MTDEEIVANLSADRAHQELALKHLYFHTGAEIGRFFRSQGVDNAEAEDLLQETILKVLRRVSTYRGDGRFESWVWQVARNALADYRRAQMPINDLVPVSLLGSSRFCISRDDNCYHPENHTRGHSCGVF